MENNLLNESKWRHTLIKGFRTSPSAFQDGASGMPIKNEAFLRIYLP